MIAGIFIVFLVASLAGGGVYYVNPQDWSLVLSVWLCVAGIGCLLLSVLYTWSFRNDFKSMMGMSRLYERDISNRLAVLETRAAKSSDSEGFLVDLAGDHDRLANRVSALSRQMEENGAQLAQLAENGISIGEAGGEAGNIISLEDAAVARKRKSASAIAEASKAKSGDRNATGGFKIDTARPVDIVPLLQPIVSLPHQELQFYEAFARMNGKDGQLIEARDFLPAFEKAGRVHDIDLAILNSVVSLIRRLQGEGREDQIPGVFWNISVKSITDKQAFARICDVLKANVKFAGTIHPEVDISALDDDINDQAHELGLLARQGFKFSLDVNADWAAVARNGYNRRELKQIVERLLKVIEILPLEFVKVPAAVLLRQQEDGGERLVDLLLPELEKRKLVLIGSRVEQEEQAINLIDHYIEYAQGSFICPPKPVNLGGSKDDNKDGDNTAEAG